MTAPSPDGHAELRPAYRTLGEPNQLLGLSLGGWATVLAAGAVGYGWLLISPLPLRANASIVVIGLGAPVALLLLREASAISPARLLAAAVRWRARPSRLAGQLPPDRGAVRLTTPPTATPTTDVADELPWIDPDHQYPAGDSAPAAGDRAGHPAPVSVARNAAGEPARNGVRSSASNQAKLAHGRAPEPTVGKEAS